jgi:predicted Na+-dependent transporter
MYDIYLYLNDMPARINNIIIRTYLGIFCMPSLADLLTNENNLWSHDDLKMYYTIAWCQSEDEVQNTIIVSCIGFKR